ncbi:unnamed protein product [Prorocentrum cordatum]|uniref:SMB domain-containing protein n=1 Tax=Prorocentrum cordatum TaxID=2364126 RepID=A0ABN9PZU5_9DINO|nr:unnamed protein product [Polarella glacialis]
MPRCALWPALTATTAENSLAENSLREAVDGEPFLGDAFTRTPCRPPLAVAASTAADEDGELWHAQAAEGDAPGCAGTASCRRRLAAAAILTSVFATAAAFAWLQAPPTRKAGAHRGRASSAAVGQSVGWPPQADQPAPPAASDARGLADDAVPLTAPLAAAPTKRAASWQQGSNFGNTTAARARSMAEPPPAGASCAESGCDVPFDPLRACQCNDECAEHDNCCDDFVDICSTARGADETPPPPGGDPDASCAKFGCIGFVKENPCQCNAGCQQRDSCCGDFNRVCAPEESEGPPEAAADSPPEGSCEEFGCSPFDADRPCQCNADCYQYDSCCPDFQKVCETGPPQTEEAPADVPADVDDEGSCKSYGCFGYDATHSCQCNADCGRHNACCSDYDSTCAVPRQEQSSAGARGAAVAPRGSRDEGGAAEDRGGSDDDDDPDPYDCTMGEAEDWKHNKRLWCCVVKEIGCEAKATAEPTPAPSTTTSKATTRKTTTSMKTTTSLGTTEDPEADIALR